jgi:hypothetical protein
LLDELNVFDKDYKKPLLGHWVHDEDKPGQYKWLTGQEFAEGNYKELEHKPRVVNPGPSTVSALGIDSNIFASNYQKPKAWTHGDHIGVAMVHAKDKSEEANAKEAKGKNSPCGVNSVGSVCNPF